MPIPSWRSVSAKAAWWLDNLQVAEIEVADCLECLGCCAVLLVLRQSFEPSHILSLQCCKLNDGVMPASGTAAMISWTTGTDHWGTCCSRGTISGLALGVCHRPLADWIAGRGSTPKRYVTKPRRRCSPGCSRYSDRGVAGLPGSWFSPRSGTASSWVQGGRDAAM